MTVSGQALVLQKEDAGIRAIIILAIFYLGSTPLTSSALRIPGKSPPVLSTQDFWDPRV